MIKRTILHIFSCLLLGLSSTIYAQLDQRLTIFAQKIRAFDATLKGTVLLPPPPPFNPQGWPPPPEDEFFDPFPLPPTDPSTSTHPSRRPSTGQEPVQPVTPPQWQPGAQPTPRPATPTPPIQPKPTPSPRPTVPAKPPVTPPIPRPVTPTPPPCPAGTIATPGTTPVAGKPITWRNYDIIKIDKPDFSSFSADRSGYYPSSHIKYQSARTQISQFLDTPKSENTVAAAQAFATSTLPLINPSLPKSGNASDLGILLDIVTVLLQMIPLEETNGHKTASDLIEILIKENEYPPHKVVATFMAPLYVKVDQLQKEVSQERELRFKIRNQMAGEVAGLGKPQLAGRTKSIELLAKYVHSCLSALHFAINQFDIIYANAQVSALDKDLYLSSIICNWFTIEKLYLNLQSILTKQNDQEPDDLKIFANFKLPSLSEREQYQSLEEIPLASYFQSTQKRVNAIITKYNPTMITPNKVLLELKAAGNQPAEKYFIDHYIPKSPEVIKQNDPIRVQYLKRARNGLYTAYKRCDTFDASILKSLDQALGKAIADDLAADKQQEEADQKLEEANNNINFIENTRSIQGLRENNQKLAAMGKKTKKDADELEKILKFQEEVIAYSQKLKEVFAAEFLSFCEVGNRPRTHQRIIEYLYNNPLYTDPTIAGKKITDDKVLDFVHASLMQTTIATLIKNTAYIPYGSCPRCTYNAAWLIAEDLLRDYPQYALSWIKEFKNEFPYADEGYNVVTRERNWYPEQRFEAKYQPQFANE